MAKAECLPFFHHWNVSLCVVIFIRKAKIINQAEILIKSEPVKFQVDVFHKMKSDCGW